MNIINNQVDLRKNIAHLESEVMELDQVDIPIKHYFANGFYAREMSMPADAVVVGKIHKSEHLCVVSQGEIEIVSEEKKERVKAPYTYVSKPGAKRALYAFSDVVWTTIHMTDEKDIEQLERDLIAESYQQLENYEAIKLCHG